MPRTYTLTRFYKEAKKLVLKHTKPANFRLRVNFCIETTEKINPTTLNCTISYNRIEKDEEFDFKTGDTAFGFGATPELALLSFKTHIKECVYVFPLVGVSVDEAFE